MSDLRFLPLTPEGKPLLPWKTRPELGLSKGLAYGPWVKEAAEQGYGVGVLLEQSGLVVIDCDSGLEFRQGHGTNEVFGWQVFQELCRSKGYEVPRTWTVQTKTPGRYHLYFRQNPEHQILRTSIHKLIAHTDVKSTGYVVSWLTRGYTVVRRVPVTTLPEWLAADISKRQSEKTEERLEGERMMTDDHADYLLGELAACTEGGRNARLHATAKAFLYAGRTADSDRNALCQAASLCGLGDSEALRTVDSAWGRL